MDVSFYCVVKLVKIEKSVNNLQPSISYYEQLRSDFTLHTGKNFSTQLLASSKRSWSGC